MSIFRQIFPGLSRNNNFSLVVIFVCPIGLNICVIQANENQLGVVLSACAYVCSLLGGRTREKSVADKRQMPSCCKSGIISKHDVIRCCAEFVNTLSIRWSRGGQGVMHF